MPERFTEIQIIGHTRRSGMSPVRDGGSIPPGSIRLRTLDTQKPRAHAESNVLGEGSRESKKPPFCDSWSGYLSGLCLRATTHWRTSSWPEVYYEFGIRGPETLDLHVGNPIAATQVQCGQ